MITVGILGSTGSIGTQTLEVLRALGKEYKVGLLACAKDAGALTRQIDEFSPAVAVCGAPVTDCGSKTKIYQDLSALADPALYKDCDIVVNGIGGLAGLMPTLAVLASPARLATANKESIVAAGGLVNAAAKKYGKTLLPVDSEHSGVWQCLENKENVSQIVLTASGGAFRDWSKEQLKTAKAKDALKHPTWSMGAKVTIDSATLFNKAMEVAEARALFEIQDIEVLIHRESIVHALVGFRDGSFKASLSSPDMRLPIQYALTADKRLPTGIKPLALGQLGVLTFGNPDYDRFPCLSLAKDLNSDYKGAIACAADELLVNYYLADRIGFYDIPEIIAEALSHFGDGEITSVHQVFGIDRAVKEYTHYCIEKKYGGTG